MLLNSFQLFANHIKNQSDMIFMRLKSFLKNTIAISTLSTALLFPMALKSQAEVIALSLPITGDFAELAGDFSLGAKLAMEQLGKDHQLFIADDGCDKDLARFAAKGVLASNPAIITGLICNESAISYANELRESGVPLLVAGARSVRLIKDRDREDWNIWRMSPGDDAAANQIAEYITTDLKDTAFALVDDGTIYGRNMTDAIRLRLNDKGMKPQFADTFRAAQSTQSGMLRRLQRSGVTVGFVAAATTEDLFTIAKDHTSLKIASQLIVTEQLASLPFLEKAEKIKGGIKVMMQPVAEKLSSTSALTALLIKRDIKPKKAIYDGYAAIQVAIAAIGTNQSETIKNLTSNRFQSIVGSVEFDKDGKNIHNPYVLHLWQNGTLEPLVPANNQ